MGEKYLLLLGFPTMILNQFSKVAEDRGFTIIVDPNLHYDGALLWKGIFDDILKNKPIFYMGVANGNQNNLSFDPETPINVILSTIQNILYPSLVTDENDLYSLYGDQKNNQSSARVG